VYIILGQLLLWKFILKERGVNEKF
jgi:hypothetical protein